MRRSLLAAFSRVRRMRRSGSPASGVLVSALLAAALLLVTSVVAAPPAPPPPTSPATDAAASPAAAVRWELVWEHWYEMELAGARAGWTRETVETDGARYRTTSEMSMRISRGAVALELSMVREFLETLAGEPLEMHMTQDLSRQTVDTSWTFAGDTVHSVSRQGGRTIEKTLPRPEGEWLTPMAAHRFWLERRAVGAEDIAYRSITGDEGIEPVTLRYELRGHEEVAFDGRKLPATVWKSTSSAAPGLSSTVKISEDGHLLYDELNLPFGRMTSRLATKEQVLEADDGPGPELMFKTFVRADRPIDRPRATRTAVMRVRTKEGPLPDLPSAGAQRVEPEEGGRTALLRVNVDDNVAADAESSADPAYLESDPMADPTDPVIVAHVRRAVRDLGPGKLERAEAMRRYVHRHVSSKVLDTVFATASETVRMRTGDCSEHGVLLCAMLRADGIPARVATGLVYAEAFGGEHDIFGWHMWTQALIDGRWVDFDATLDDRFDAVHVLTGTSSLADGVGGADLVALLQLLGNLDVQVVEVGY